jgi:hypothetical protein
MLEHSWAGSLTRIVSQQPYATEVSGTAEKVNVEGQCVDGFFFGFDLGVSAGSRFLHRSVRV